MLRKFWIIMVIVEKLFSAIYDSLVYFLNFRKILKKVWKIWNSFVEYKEKIWTNFGNILNIFWKDFRTFLLKYFCRIILKILKQCVWKKFYYSCWKFFIISRNWKNVGEGRANFWEIVEEFQLIAKKFEKIWK